MIKKECPEPGCNKEIEGYKDSQVDYLMKQHALAKHNKGD